MTTDMLSAAENRLLRRARQYIDSGQMTAAQTILESLAQRLPNDASVRMQLADVLLRCGRMHAATRQLLDAVPLLSDDAEAIAQLARSLYFNGETVAARACFEHPEVAHTRSAQGLVALTRARSLLDEPQATLALMERVLAAGIDTPDEHFTRALLLQFTGRIDEAAAELENCMVRWPTFSSAAMGLMRLRRQTDTRHLDLLRRHVARIPADNIVHAEFQFALFKLLDDLGRHDEAWVALAAGNAVMHALRSYDAVGEAAMADTIIGHSATIAAANLTPPPTGPTPIFIVGMPRSGTTLLDRMLSSHSQVVSAGELSDLVRQLRWVTNTPDAGLQGLATIVERSVDIDFADLGTRYLKQTQWRAGASRYYIDKLPNNFRFVNLIHRALPHAPIVHMRREPMDVCFSNFKAMFGNVSAYSYELQALAHYHRQYRRVMEHWHTTMPGVVLDVHYATLVRDPQTTMQRVLRHCGLELEDDCLHPERNMAPVATPSSAQVREPIHARGLDEWRHYSAQLQPLRAALG